MNNNHPNIIINFDENGRLRIMKNSKGEYKIQISRGDNKIQIRTSDEIFKLKKDINNKLKKINDIPILPDFSDFISNNRQNYPKIPPGINFFDNDNKPIPKNPFFR